MIKAVFFDIDGTLLSYSTHAMLPGTLRAFAAMQRRGIRTFISSGRPRVLIPTLPVAFDGYITVNGGHVQCGDTVLLKRPIDDEDCRRWLHYVEQKQMTTMCFTEHEMYINRIDEPTRALQRQLQFQLPPMLPLEQMEGKEVYQFIAMQPPEADAAVLQLLSHCRLPRWHKAFTDVIPDDSSKAVGIDCILSHFGLHRDEAMAFGDGENDVEMLDFVGCSVAMGNASDTVKAHADYVTDSADDEGIAKALAHLGVIDNKDWEDR